MLGALGRYIYIYIGTRLCTAPEEVGSDHVYVNKIHDVT